MKAFVYVFFFFPLLVFIIVGYLIYGIIGLSFLNAGWNVLHGCHYIEGCPPAPPPIPEPPTPIPTPSPTPVPKPVSPPTIRPAFAMPWEMDDEFWRYRGGWKVAFFIWGAVNALLVLLILLLLGLRQNDGAAGGVIFLLLFSGLAWVLWGLFTWFDPLDQYDYEVAEEYEKAIEHWSVDIYSDPEDAGNFNRRGNLYLRLGQYERAIEDYNEAIGLEPESAVDYFNRSLAYMELGQYEDASGDRDQACKLASKYCE